jgi:8-oxo-dGTP diphosphatase
VSDPRRGGAAAAAAAPLTRLAIRLWRCLPGWLRGVLTWWFNAHFVVGTVAIVEDDRGRVLLARHTYRRHAPWALPGGWVRRGEDPSDTIVREISEETRFAVEVIAPLTVQREGSRHFTIVYAARLAGGTFRPSAEVSEVCFAGPGEWPPGLREDHRVLLERLSGPASRRR